jgi:hypothetical protein
MAKRYLVETNRSKRTTRENAHRLLRMGFDTQRLTHQPTVIIAIDHASRPSRLNIERLMRLADNPLASVVIASLQTGNVYQCDRRGNRPDTLVKLSP